MSEQGYQIYCYNTSCWWLKLGEGTTKTRQLAPVYTAERALAVVRSNPHLSLFPVRLGCPLPTHEEVADALTAFSDHSQYAE